MTVVAKGRMFRPQGLLRVFAVATNLIKSCKDFIQVLFADVVIFKSLIPKNNSWISTCNRVTVTLVAIHLPSARQSKPNYE